MVATVVEGVIFDPHDNPKGYEVMKRLLESGKKLSRVFVMGDFSQMMNHERLAELNGGNKKLKTLEARFNDPKTPNPEKQKIATEHMKTLFDEVLLVEGKERHKMHDDYAKLFKKYNVNTYGVAGNHDQSYILSHAKQIVPNIDMMQTTDSLVKEKIVGATGYIDHSMNEAWAFTNYVLAVPSDDNPDINKSEIYAKHKNTPIDLLVTHAYPSVKAGQFEIKAHGECAGEKALMKKNKPAVYVGHTHGSYVCRDDDGILHVCFGIKYAGVVHRIGKDVSKIEIYKLADLN